MKFTEMWNEPDNTALLLQNFLHAHTDAEQAPLFDALVRQVNYLLTEDFAGLVQLLYRVDVSEERIRQVVADNPGTDELYWWRKNLLNDNNKKKTAAECFSPKTNPPMKNAGEPNCSSRSKSAHQFIHTPTRCRYRPEK